MISLKSILGFLSFFVNKTPSLRQVFAQSIKAMLIQCILSKAAQTTQVTTYQNIKLMNLENKISI